MTPMLAAFVTGMAWGVVLGFVTCLVLVYLVLRHTREQASAYDVIPLRRDRWAS